MADIIATVVDPYGSLTDSNNTSVTADQTSVPPNTIENMLDVDLQQLTDGSLLIYRNNTAKWHASSLLDKQTMEGGEF